VPAAPAGLRYTDVAINFGNAMAIRSDGEAVGWGWLMTTAGPPVAPPRPAGVGYTRVSVSTTHGLLLRSDGVVVAFGDNSWGQCNVPALPPGVPVREMKAIFSRSIILMDDGTTFMFGDNQLGQSSAPTLPPGVRYVAIGSQVIGTTLLLRSDGQVEAFGDNSLGLLNVPPLPPGTTYEHVGAGEGFAVAARSDNQFVVWGTYSPTFGLDTPPTIPPGTRCSQLSVGQIHAAGLLTDGTVVSWGHNAFFDHFTPYRSVSGQRSPRRQVDASVGTDHSLVTYSDGTMVAFGREDDGRAAVPPLPPGLRYVKGAAGGIASLALRSDGSLVGFGSNAFGGLSIPLLPSGMTYTDMAICQGHSAALRSDGNVLAFGWNPSGQCNVPALTGGLTYTKVAVNDGRTLLLRSDGTLAFCGWPYAGTLPSPPPGTRFVDIAAAGFFGAALASDASLALFGSVGGSGWSTPAPLPSGIYYVELRGSYWAIALRRSDGRIDVLGTTDPHGTSAVPEIDAATSAVQLAGVGVLLGARMGPTCTYVGVTPGCAGSLPPSRLIPLDTPKIGRLFEVEVDRLPANIALMAMGFHRPAVPVPLSAIGMPGCALGIQVDAVGLLTAQGSTAPFRLPIPDLRALVGLRFYNQALVLDPGANSFGAVLSEGSDGVIGYP
jgi:hypothetical protein